MTSEPGTLSNGYLLVEDREVARLLDVATVPKISQQRVVVEAAADVVVARLVSGWYWW
jgi:hypothetical protein